MSQKMGKILRWCMVLVLAIVLIGGQIGGQRAYAMTAAPQTQTQGGSSGEADTEVMGAMNRLEKFIFQVVSVLGGLIALFGILQLALSFNSHDSSQRMNGIIAIAGGVLVLFAPSIINFIKGG